MLREQFPELPHGRDVVADALAASLRPPPRRSVAAWADEKRYVAPESGSPYPGKWDTELVPYLRDIMAVLSLSDPAREVTLKASAQIAKTEAAINLFGHVVDENPSTVLIVQANLDEASKFNNQKLQPAIDHTPALRNAIRRQRARDAGASTTWFKRFRGGFAQITGANSSSGLQSLSARVLIGDELSEWPWDVDGRGDPLTMAEQRTKAYSTIGYKRFYLSTPGIAGSCRISAKYRESDQRQLYVRCPHCGQYQIIRPDALQYRSDAAPHGAYVVCRAHGCVIEQHHRREMRASGAWIKTYPGDETPPEVASPEQIERLRQRSSHGREPGFHLWQVHSPFVSWDDTIGEYLAAKDEPRAYRVFTQQALGEAHEESGEAPDHEKLHAVREDYPLRQVPPGGIVLTGYADLQHDRIEYAVYAWGVGLTGWLVDFGVCWGDPDREETFAQLDDVVERTYPDANGTPRAIEAFGMDSGFKPNRVYLWTRKRDTTLATKGMANPLHPYLGSPSRMDVSYRGRKLKNGAYLWPVGTWQLKSWLYASLRKTLEGPDDTGALPAGALHFPTACDPEFFRQLTAEYLKETEQRNGTVKREWTKRSGQPNEQLDMACGARAMAYHLGLDFLTDAEWRQLAATRQAPPNPVQPSLASLWAGDPQREARQAQQPAQQGTAEQPAPKPAKPRRRKARSRHV